MSSSCGKLALAVAAAALLLAPALAADPPPDQGGKSSWWSWWSWGDGIFGINIGGVSYGGGPHRLVGSDKLVHELRLITGAQAIELAGPINVVLKQGQVEKATLHTDDNIAALVQTSVEGGVLHIGIQPGASFRTKHPIGLTIELPKLSALRVLGSGDITCAQFDADVLEIDVRGSGDVHIDGLRAPAVAVLVQGSGNVQLSGSVPKQGFEIEGSGDVDAEELAGAAVAVRVTGSGDAKVWATESLQVQITGSGDVSYRGQPALTRSVTGSGSLTHR
jgi:hypothetical protein